MRLKPGGVEHIVTLGVLGGGLTLALGMLRLVPSAISYKLVTAGLRSVNKFLPNIMPEGKLPESDRVRSVNSFIRKDLANASVALLGFAAIEEPTALNQYVTTNIGKFMEAVPDVIPTVLFVAGLTYLTSAFWMKATR